MLLGQSSQTLLNSDLARELLSVRLIVYVQARPFQAFSEHKAHSLSCVFLYLHKHYANFLWDNMFATPLYRGQKLFVSL
ncbi:MAG: hypothetical protein J6V36_01500 [Clostridia bacterium]|nr:hypothetical protein [Clostridia bacterium]